MMMNKDIISTYINNHILECCKHSHSPITNSSSLKTTIQQYLKATTNEDEESRFKNLEEALCLYYKQKEKEELPPEDVVENLIQKILADKKEKERKNLGWELFGLVIKYQSVKMVRQLREVSNDIELRILIEYWIKNSEGEVENKERTQQTDQLFSVLSDVTQYSSNKILDIFLDNLLRNCLFNSLLTLQGLSSPQTSIEDLQTISPNTDKTEGLKDSLDKIIQNIYLIAIESKEIYRSLMQWIGLCINHSILKQHIYKGDYVIQQLIKVLLKVQELFTNSEAVKQFIKDLKPLPSTSPLLQKLLKQLLSVNNKKIIEDHQLQLLDFDIVSLYPLFYSKLFPLALKSIDKINQNVTLINYIVKIKFQIEADWNVVIKNEGFWKFFRHICHYLTWDNLLLIYRSMSEGKEGEEVLDVLMERGKKRVFQTEDRFLQYLLLEKMFSSEEPKLLEVAVRILSHFKRKSDNDQWDLYHKYYQKCWNCYLTINTPPPTTIIRMIGLQSAFQQSQINKHFQILITQLHQQAWTQESNQKHLLLLLSIFNQHPNKTSTLALLRYTFFFILSPTFSIGAAITVLLSFKQKLEQNIYYQLHCYNHEAFDELLLIYSIEGAVNEEFLNICQEIILKWINYTKIKQIYHLYEIARYQISSEFIQGRIKLLNNIDKEKNSKVFTSVDNRLCRFLKLFFSIISYEGLSKQLSIDQNKCIVYNHQKNLLSLIYKFYQKQFDSPFEVLVTIQNNPEYPQPCVFYIRQPNLEHKFSIVKNEITLTKIFKQDSKVISQKCIRGSNCKSALSIKLEVDLDKETAVVDINREQFQFIVFRNSQKQGVSTKILQTIQVGIQTSDSYIQNFDIVYNTTKKLSFNMNTSNQTQKRFTLNINQLNILKVFNSLECLSLRYLFVFILQIAKNQFSYSLHSIDLIFPLIYKIVFYQIEQSPKATDFFGLFTFLEYVTKVIIEMASTVCFNDIRSNTIRLMMKPNRMGLEFFKQIILNFEIWSPCSFVAQNIILDIIITVLKQSHLAEKLIVEDLSYFHQISEYIPKYFLPSSPSKKLKPEDKEQLKSKVQEILFTIISKTNVELFERYVGLILKSSIQQTEVTKFGKKSSITKRPAAGVIERIVAYYLSDKQNKGYDNKRQIFFIALMKMKEFKIIADNVSQEISDRLFECALRLCKTKKVPGQVYGNLKILLSSLSLMAVESHFPLVFNFLQSQSEFKSQQKLIFSLLKPFLQRYQSFSLDIKSKILTYLNGLLQINNNLTQKSNAFTVKLLCSSEFVQLIVNLSDEDFVDIDLRPQCKTLLNILWDSIYLMSKQMLFSFLYLFRKKSGARLNLLITPILKFNAVLSTIVDCSLIIQYAYECLLIYQTIKGQKNQIFFISILNLIQDITFQKSNELYSTDIAIGKNSQVDKKKLMEMSKKPFEIRGGILYKLILLLFEYLKLTEDEKIVEKIKEILITNVDKSEDLRNFRKSRGSSLFGLTSEKSLNLGSAHQFELLMRRTSKSVVQKYPDITTEVGQNIHSQKQYKEGHTWAHLEFAALKISIFLQNCSNFKTKMAVGSLVNELSHKYPHLITEFHPDNMTVGETYQFSQFIKLFTEDASDFNKYEPKLIDTTSPLRRTTSYKYQTITPIKRKYSTAPKEIQISKFQKQNAPKKACKMLKVEFAYRYILKNNISSEEQTGIEEENQRMLKQFKDYVLKQNEIKQTNKNQANIYWKQFLEQVQGQNGFLQQTIHKKKPILKLRGVHLPNMMRGITQYTQQYQYQLIKQQTISLNQKQSFLSYSFLKPKSFLNTQERQKISVLDIFPPVIEQIESSGGSYKIYSQWVTRRGVYFSKFNLDVVNEKIFVQANQNGRPEKPEYIFGSTKDLIIKGKSKSLQIKFSQIKQIFVRRYNQIPNNALEIFTHNCSSYYFVFYSRKYVKSLLQRLRLSSALKQEQFITDVEATFKERKYTEKWQSGKISNFDYLMLINIFSGRTFNDPNQYPIFPWIISDYNSNDIDLKNSKTYRDLSLPIGALNTQKLERYMDNSRIHEQQEEYLYGSFLSTSMFVFYYLVRIQPFSSLARQLQGGHFDSPDRLFNSLSDVWRSLTCQSNTSDVKELIPEFYNINIFLQNKNRLDFGKTQIGKTIDDVVLPPWASNSNNFISIMKEALESDMVSSKLHLWIDLIFGSHQYSKQRHNQFHPRYYEKNINFSQVEKHEIEPLIAQITYFGQFPKKIFSKDHLPRTQFIKRPLKFKQVSREDLATGYVQKIKKSADAFIIGIHQNKYSKTYSIKIPFQNNIKRYEIQKSSAYKTGQLLLVESNNYSIYYRSIQQSVFLKKFQTDIPISFKKSVISNRYVILYGHDLTVLNFEGKTILTLLNVEPKAAIILDNILVFLDKKFCLKKLNILSPEKIQTIYVEEPKYCHCQLMGYRIGNYEGYLLCFNRSYLIYIAN